MDYRGMPMLPGLGAAPPIGPMVAAHDSAALGHSAPPQQQSAALVPAPLAVVPAYMPSNGAAAADTAFGAGPSQPELSPRPMGLLAAFKRKPSDQGSMQPPNQRRHLMPPGLEHESPDVRDLRALLEDKLRPIAEHCMAAGLEEMAAEVHGYPLSKVKEDFRGAWRGLHGHV